MRKISTEVDFARLSRRRFIEKASLCALGAIGAKRSISVAAQALQGHKSAPRDELVFRPAGELARLISSKAISSEEVVRAMLRRIEDVNPRLNAVCQLVADRALREAKLADSSLAAGKPLGALHGVPITIKDSLDTAGIISTAGTTGRSQYVPKEDATVVARLRAAGAIILGKTNTPELTLSYETDNLIYRRTNNPYNLARTCGGSSGGAAAIISAGGSPLDIGSDTAGSIRVPAHFCGIAGLKPSFGRVSRAGHIFPPGGVIGRRTHIGPMARYVQDLNLILPLICGPDPRDTDVAPVGLEEASDVMLKTLRVAFFTDNGRSRPSADVVRAVRAATGVLSAQGSPVEEKLLPGFKEVDPILAVLNSGDGGDYYRKILKQCGTTVLHPDTAALLDRLRSGVISARKYSDVLLDWGHLREEGMKFMTQHELLICPIASATAPEHGTSNDLDFSYSYLFNALGWPTAVVRAGTSAEGLPVGVQIVGRPWKDHEVLAAAFRIEQALGGWKHDFPEHALTGPSGAAPESIPEG